MTRIHLAAVTAAAIVLLAPAGAPARTVPFANPVTISSTFTGAADVAAGDLDGDGDLDVVAVAAGLGHVSWWENDGGWTLHPIGTMATGISVIDVADIDGDGDLDVVGGSANGTSDVLFWWANSGDGSSWSGTAIASGFTSVVGDFALGDPDRDGDLDVIVALPDLDRVWWYENTAGDGSAWTGAPIGLNILGATAVEAVDLDRDGDLDVAIAAAGENEPWWAENVDGAGGVWSPAPLGVSILTLANDLAVGDVDGDGDPDLVVSKDADSILLIENTAGDASAWSSSFLYDPNEPGALTLHDLDRDGDLDLVGASVSDDDLRWWENRIDDGLPWVEHLVASSFGGPSATAVADLDGDGDPEILAAAGDDGRVALWPNRDIHRSAVVRDAPLVGSGLGSVQRCAAGDLDRDGDVDIAAVARADDRVLWFSNDGSPGDGGWNEHEVTGSTQAPLAVAVGDVDADGLADLVVSHSQGAPIVVWYRNDGTPADGGWTTYTIDSASASAESLAVADLDLDGDLDAVAAGNDGVTWYENDGSAPAVPWAEQVLGTGAVATDVVVADLDRDGDPDVVATQLDGMLLLFENDGTPGNGGWTSHPLPSTAARLDAVEVADLDGDGDLDVATVVTSDETLVWYESDGAPADGGWTEHLVAAAISSVGDLEAADVDQDGDVDLVMPEDVEDRIVLFLNDGSPADGGWVRVESSALTALPADVELSDLDLDGDLDVVAVTQFGDAVHWLPNRGGQLAVVGNDVAPSTAGDGELVAMLEIVATHRGRAGDRRAELTGLGVAIQDEVGIPYSTPTASAVIDELAVWLDDGSGAFEPGADLLVQAVATLSLDGDGVQALSIPAGDPSGRVPALQSRTYFVTAELTPDASQQTPSSFRLVLRAASTTASDPGGTPLSLEDPVDAPSGVLDVAVPGLPFADGFESGDTSAWSTVVP